MFIQSQNKFGLVNVDNITAIHIHKREVSNEVKEMLSEDKQLGENLPMYSILASVGVDEKSFELGKYYTEEDCVRILNSIKNCYKQSTVINNTAVTQSMCFPKAVVFEMPEADEVYKINTKSQEV